MNTNNNSAGYDEALIDSIVSEILSLPAPMFGAEHKTDTGADGVHSNGTNLGDVWDSIQLQRSVTASPRSVLSPPLSPTTTTTAAQLPRLPSAPASLQARRTLFSPAPPRMQALPQASMAQGARGRDPGTFSSTGHAFLDAAANDNVALLRRLLESGSSVGTHLELVDAQVAWAEATDTAGSPYATGRKRRTALMVAASRGALSAIAYLARQGANVNARSEDDGATALHCAASGGSLRAGDTVWALLRLDADRTIRDNFGRLPMDVIIPEFSAQAQQQQGENGLDQKQQNAHSIPSMAAEPKLAGIGGGAPTIAAVVAAPPPAQQKQTSSPSTPSATPPPSPKKHAPQQLATAGSGTVTHLQAQHGPHIEDDEAPSMLDMPEFCTDEFRMYHFKVLPCCRPEAHNWRECPFVHVDETARRRDPRKFSYSSDACPDFRRGSCPHMDACTKAHGVFECWLHPAKYRTKLCKDAGSCTRRVCFFAHGPEQLRNVGGDDDAASTTSSSGASGTTTPATPERSLSLPSPADAPMCILASPSRVSDHVTPPPSPREGLSSAKSYDFFAKDQQQQHGGAKAAAEVVGQKVWQQRELQQQSDILTATATIVSGRSNHVVGVVGGGSNANGDHHGVTNGNMSNGQLATNLNGLSLSENGENNSRWGPPPVNFSGGASIWSSQAPSAATVFGSTVN